MRQCNGSSGPLLVNPLRHLHQLLFVRVMDVQVMDVQVMELKFVNGVYLALECFLDWAAGGWTAVDWAARSWREPCTWEGALTWRPGAAGARRPSSGTLRWPSHRRREIGRAHV